MTHIFLTGFYDELVKTAAPPLLQTVGKSGTMLGQKVQGAVSRSLKRSEKIGRRAARGAGLKKVIEKTSSEDGGFYEEDEEDESEGEGDADEAGEMLRRIMAQYQQDGGYSEEPEAPADAPLYGTGAPKKKGVTKHAEKLEVRGGPLKVRGGPLEVRGGPLGMRPAPAPRINDAIFPQALEVIERRESAIQSNRKAELQKQYDDEVAKALKSRPPYVMGQSQRSQTKGGGMFAPLGLAGIKKGAGDSFSGGYHQQARRDKREPQLAPPRQATKAQREGWQGADLSSIPMAKQAPKSRNLQSELDGLPDPAPSAPKTKAPGAPRAVQGRPPRLSTPRTLPTNVK